MTQIVFVDERMFGEAQHDWRNHIGERHSVLLHDLQALLHVESRHRHDRRAHVQAQVHDDHHAVDVKEGQHAQHGVVFVDVQAARRLEDVGHEVVVRQHHALGQAGRPARVRQRDDLSPRVDRDRRRGAAPSEQRRKGRGAVCGTVCLGEHEHLTYSGVASRVAGLVETRRDRDERPRASV